MLFLLSTNFICKVVDPQYNRLIEAVLVRVLKISRVENEKGLCAYIIYMHIAPFYSQP